MRLLVLEIAFILVALAGLALINIPAALIIGGVLGMLACERGSSRVSKGRSAS